MHYFHKDFLELSDTKSRHQSIVREGERARSDGSSVQGLPWESASPLPDFDLSDRPEFTTKKLRCKSM